MQDIELVCKQKKNKKKRKKEKQGKKNNNNKTNERKKKKKRYSQHTTSPLNFYYVLTEIAIYIYLTQKTHFRQLNIQILPILH